MFFHFIQERNYHLKVILVSSSSQMNCLLTIHIASLFGHKYLQTHPKSKGLVCFGKFRIFATKWALRFSLFQSYTNNNVGRHYPIRSKKKNPNFLPQGGAGGKPQCGNFYTFLRKVKKHSLQTEIYGLPYMFIHYDDLCAYSIVAIAVKSEVTDGQNTEANYILAQLAPVFRPSRSS